MFKFALYFKVSRAFLPLVGIALLVVINQDVSLPLSGVSASGPVEVAAALTETDRAMRFWLRLGVDGFVVTNLHQLVTSGSADQVRDDCTNVFTGRHILRVLNRRHCMVLFHQFVSKYINNFCK